MPRVERNFGHAGRKVFSFLNEIFFKDLSNMFRLADTQ